MEIPFSLEEVVVENIRSGVLVHFEPEEYEYAKKVKEKCREVGIGEFHNNPLELHSSEDEDTLHRFSDNYQDENLILLKK